MTDQRVPLSVLDLSPITSGGTIAEAMRNSVDLARRVEAAGYCRHWVAEHHLTPGVASAAPALLISQIAAATSTIRVGSGAVQTGHQTALSVVEQFGILDAFFPGRIDLGLGRSAPRRAQTASKPESPGGPPARPRPRPERITRVVDGLLIPKPFSYARLLGSAQLGHLQARLHQPGAQSPDYGEQVREVLGYLAGTEVTPDGEPVHAVPGEAADVEVWIFGSSGGQSAQVAGELGLPFAVSYHISPGTVLEAIDGYRAAFRPSSKLSEPYVAVSADVVVAPDDSTAEHLASPYGLWVRSARSGQRAIPFPTPDQAAAHLWSDEDRELVADRVDTQFVGSPSTVVAGLDTLVEVTGADELVVTTITHKHADRVRSHELLAEEWFTAQPVRITEGAIG